MARYTFTCEHFNYNDFNGREETVSSKHTTEFRADDLTTMIENYEMFLRGSGFNFDGVLDVVPNEPVEYGDSNFETESIGTNTKAWDWTVNQLQTNPIEFQSGIYVNSDNMGSQQDLFTESINLDDINLSLSELNPNYVLSDEIDIRDISINFDTTDIEKTFTLVGERCSVCKLSLEMMKNHTCFDTNCPLKNAN